VTLSKDQILAAEDIPTKDVEVPEWGGSVRMRGLTGSERDAYELSLWQVRGEKRILRMENARARLVAMCIVDENGERMFSDAEAKDLGRKSGKVLDRLFDEARKLSGLTAEDVEELAEGFDSAQSGEPGSG
jgi:hypothetical protein